MGTSQQQQNQQSGQHRPVRPKQKNQQMSYTRMNNRGINHTEIIIQQQGFVLVLVLVMLAVMTLIGVSSMNNANLELRATANERQHQLAFNAVQSLLAHAITVTPAAATMFDFQTTSTTPQTLSYVMPATSNLSASAVYAGCSVGVGSSLGKGKSFSYSFYNITGSGSNQTGTATSIQTQGIRYPAAACN